MTSDTSPQYMKVLPISPHQPPARPHLTLQAVNPPDLMNVPKWEEVTYMDSSSGQQMCSEDL